MVRAQIIGYSETGDCHIVKDEQGLTMRVDLFVDGSFADYPSGTISEYTGISKKGVNAEIMGKFVEIEQMLPYEYIAKNVKLIK